MSRPRRRQQNRGWFKPGYDPRRHQLTPEERSRGGVQAYGRLLMERPGTAWWVLNERIRPQGRAERDAAIWAYVRERLANEPDDIPY
jgi:hypothetical protein